jgi:hypothetical protein
MLPGLDRSPRARVLAWFLLLAVLASRLLLMPAGPWEQDEALFAGGVLDFDIHRHSPHPPGFPGWILLGKTLDLFLDDPLLSLRLLSSFASVALFVLLAHALKPVAGGRLGTACALLFCFLPVSWAHAPRAFSTTPALAFAVGAFVCWMGPLAKKRSLLGWALLGFACTVRPQLAPVFIVLAVGGAWMQRSRRTFVIHGLFAASAVAGVVYMRAAIDAGGPLQYLEVSFLHYQHHIQDIGESGPLPIAEQGFVRGLGGALPAVMWILLAGFGAARAWLRLGRPGQWLVLLAVIALASVQLLHHPGFPRYAVATVAATLPLVAFALDALPKRRQAIAIPVLGATAGATATAPAMLEMHAQPLPIYVALARAQDSSDDPLVHSHGSFSFARLAQSSGWVTRELIDEQRLGAFPSVDGPFGYVGSDELRALPGLTVHIRQFTDFPPRAWALSQRRYDRARWIRNPVWLGEGSHHVEEGQGGQPFSWLSERVQLYVPGDAARLVLALELNEGMAPQRLRAKVRDETIAQAEFAEPGRHRVEVPLAGCKYPCVVSLELPTAKRARADDDRRLSVRLRAAWVEGERFVLPGQRFNPGVPGSLMASDVQLTGFHRPDSFLEGELPGAWTGAKATMRFPARRGFVRLRLARPAHLQGPVRVTTSAGTQSFDIGKMPADYWVAIRPKRGLEKLSIEAPSFVPSQRDAQSPDDRELGVIVLDVAWTPFDQIRPWPKMD